MNADRPWFDHTTDVKPRLDRFRDPKGWLLDSLPWPLRRLVMSWRMKEWVPNGARYVGMRRPPWEAFDWGRKLYKESLARAAGEGDGPEAFAGTLMDGLEDEDATGEEDNG